AVAGSSGWVYPRWGYHPAMFASLQQLGSLVIDIDRNRLDAKFLRETGAIDDSFTIIKGEGPEPLRLMSLQFSFGRIVARWKSIAGHNYQLQWTPDLGKVPWDALSNVITATGATTFSTNLLPDGLTQAFVRVVEIPQK